MRDSQDVDPQRVISADDTSSITSKTLTIAAAILWCKSMTWPSVQAILGTVNITADTADALGQSSLSQEALVQSEVGALMALYRDKRRFCDTPEEALDAAAIERTQHWVSVSSSLLYLPLMACVAAQARENHRLACVRAISAILEPAAE